MIRHKKNAVEINKSVLSALYMICLFIVRMRFDKLKKQLELLILLSDGRNYTVEELCERMNLSRRNFYYLLDFINMLVLSCSRIKAITILTVALLSSHS